MLQKLLFLLLLHVLFDCRERVNKRRVALCLKQWRTESWHHVKFHLARKWACPACYWGRHPYFDEGQHLRAGCQIAFIFSKKSLDRKYLGGSWLEEDCHDYLSEEEGWICWGFGDRPWKVRTSELFRLKGKISSNCIYFGNMDEYSRERIRIACHLSLELLSSYWTNIFFENFYGQTWHFWAPLWKISKMRTQTDFGGWCHFFCFWRVNVRQGIFWSGWWNNGLKERKQHKQENSEFVKDYLILLLMMIQMDI